MSQAKTLMVHDLVGSEAEAGTVEPGLNLLPIETYFRPPREKQTLQAHVRLVSLARRGLFSHLNDRQNLRAYQIHLGRTDTLPIRTGSPLFVMNGADETDGWLSEDSWCGGCYMHGLFENDAFRHGILRALAERRSMRLKEVAPFDRLVEYDKLADLLERSLDMQQLEAVCDLI